MKISIKAFASTMGLALLTTLLPGAAMAGCGARASQEGPAPNFDSAPEPNYDNHGKAPTIVGMWKVIFAVPGANGASNLFDYGYAQWHSDKTEIFNSGGRPPSTQNFCVGVWEQTGARTYTLNHFAFNYNDGVSNGANGAPIYPPTLVGKVNIKETVTLSEGGSKFTGTFVITEFDATGNQIFTISGSLQGLRVTVDTVDNSTP